ncbi:type II toxin-antitoxin system prevent-host-death family antitoxin [Agrobacterium sp. a22-2]|uniref:type II toxin-antitoxin system Phd/YefM family antitoxin n=1 Tax=Agrobacterium sp. a22-2 TaxID=2283840 RepID=UPI00144537E1|nr:type II toxin-antitoxin system prevent-host-death family antitoxin [Agrobacterium sp. a22-2]NKN37866.1 type II toxin-antitoxin system prevent-host-death family antitoxin [Agrobacterium sp. a22-2]
MAHVNVSEFRQNLASHLDEVADSRAPLVVTRGKGKSVVVLSEEEYDSMVETLHLLASPINAERLRSSIAELDAGQGAERQLSGEQP